VPTDIQPQFPLHGQAGGFFLRTSR
jgi:hypothetical protein